MGQQRLSRGAAHLGVDGTSCVVLLKEGMSASEGCLEVRGDMLLIMRVLDRRNVRSSASLSDLAFGVGGAGLF